MDRQTIFNRKRSRKQSKNNRFCLRNQTVEKLSHGWSLTVYIALIELDAKPKAVIYCLFSTRKQQTHCSCPYKLENGKQLQLNWMSRPAAISNEYFMYLDINQFGRRRLIAHFLKTIKPCPMSTKALCICFLTHLFLIRLQNRRKRVTNKYHTVHRWHAHCTYCPFNQLYNQ